MPKHGKKYREALALIDRSHVYSPREALELAKKTSFASFDTTVEIHMRMGVDPRHADQQVRGVVLLPKGTGKEVRILVFAEGEAALPDPATNWPSHHADLLKLARYATTFKHYVTPRQRPGSHPDHVSRFT